MKVTFIIKKAAKRYDTESMATIYVRFRNGRRLDSVAPTQLAINPNLWDDKDECVKTKAVCNEEMRTHINEEIRQLKTYIEKVYQQEKETIDKEWLKTTLDKFYHPEKYFLPEEVVIKPTIGELFDEFLNKHPLSEVRKKNFRVVKRALLRYELYVRATKRGQKGFILDMDLVTPDTLRDMWDFFQNEYQYYELYPSIYETIPEKRTPQPRSKNTLIDCFSRIRTFFLWSFDNKRTTNRPFDKFPIEECTYGTPYYITLEERDRIFNADLSATPQFPYDSLYPSQKDAIWMIKQNGGGICWHEVGTGKTMIMCVAAYEMKRLGLAHKPLIIGLKANVHEIADTFRKAYPTAKVLYPGKDDFTAANRQEVFSKIKNNNWDCIILTHDQFAKIPQSEETMIDIFTEELADVERNLEFLEQSTMRYRSGKMQEGLEKRKQNLGAKLQELRMKINNRKDDAVDFHTMGIDHIFVDECHIFKNLMFQTRHNRVAGIGNTKGSQRAMNLLFAIRDIQLRTGRDLGATFLSGTVVVNALTELYVMFKYLRPQELQRQRISCFDAWAAIFTKKTADYELNVTGSVKRKERFRTYIKVPELAMFLREITDYRTADMINLDVPEKNVRFLSYPPTIEQEEMIGRLVSFAGSGQWEDLGLDVPQPDNLDKAKMLVVTNVARKMALDMRLLGCKFKDDADNKASICARTIYDYYIRSNDNRGTQFVFSDLGTYKPNEWNIYTDIKEKLVRLGIPADEIQFIQCATTERTRKKLFEEMNNGKVRVLFGSTTMLGTGVNAQQRAVAVHHLEIPWRPADMEQRNGRAVRKGNTVKLWGGNVVDIVIYGTEKTLDAYKFNLLKNKQMFINQI